MEFIHSVLASYEAVTAGTVVTYELPVNPLSHIFLALCFQQDKANEALDWDNVDALIDRVEILHEGSAQISINGSDLAALNASFFNWQPSINNRLGADDEYTSFTFLVPLTRKLYNPAECFPASTRGKLVLQITYAASFTDIDNVRALIETVELPEANPERFLRATTLTRTPTAAGEYDIELPIGNVLAGVLFFGTTKPVGAVDTKTLDYGQLLINNQRRYYSHTNYEIWRTISSQKARPPVEHAYHYHQLQEAAYAQWDYTSTVVYRNDWNSQHQIWDFYPMGFDEYLIDTAGFSQFVARVNAGDTNALRVIPLELVTAEAIS